MKIGIETIYDSYNFGCFLQAYAMQNLLKSQGHNVVIIDHSDLKGRIKRRYFAKSIRRTFIKLRRYFAFKKVWKTLPIEKFSQAKRKDLTIIGSDEVWNIKNASFAHLPQFYGINCTGNKVIIYGPSLGFSTYDDYINHQNYLDAIKNNIDGYLVRDDFTKDFLKKIGIIGIDRVCDPTFLIHDKWESLRKPCKIDNDYLLYYSYHSDTPFKEYIKRFARDNNLKLIVAGFDYKWCDEQRIIDPFEFLDLVSNAKYVVTSTFHGSIFSMIFKKKFAVIHPNDKVLDLMNHYSVDQIVPDNSSYKEFCEFITKEVNYDQVFAIIEKDRAFSIERINHHIFG